MEPSLYHKGVKVLLMSQVDYNALLMLQQYARFNVFVSIRNITGVFKLLPTNFGQVKHMAVFESWSNWPRQNRPR